ncbi:MAG: SAM-dependent methyltransferase [Clostridiales bacterium GWF2_38_85]|nr:MAG: SAM-dependent methyltransferase [Clostridiales bacterium GWF2_38_85]HBL84647.1 rRNA large subunit methyltransferase I [Clostridiales bacterium]
MKQRYFIQIKVTQKAREAIETGHPWVYEGEVLASAEEAMTVENGSLVDVVSETGKYLGTGMYSEKSKIRVRIISRNANDRFDSAFYERRIKYAWDYRKTVMGEDINACRIIFGEADFFPGLTVDRFGDILVTQTLSFGIEKLKPVIFPLLYKVLTDDGQKINGIFERNDVAIRKLEGLEQNKGWVTLDVIATPESTVTTICENGIEYEVDFGNGQKTGFFLDQKYNRQAVARIARGKKVLDCFTHTGSFALNAAKGGAEHVNAVDISVSVIELAKKNAVRNGLDSRMEFTVANVFDLLQKMIEEKDKSYDFIILDPPAFTKSRKTITSATRGYKEINTAAMKLLPRGGYLATCSCSHFMEDKLFIKMLHAAAIEASVQLRQIEVRQQSCDHPILWNVPETDYLKFYIFQVI